MQEDRAHREANTRERNENDIIFVVENAICKHRVNSILDFSSLLNMQTMNQFSDYIFFANITISTRFLFVSTSANSSLSQFPNLGLIILYCFNISTTKLEAPMYFENELPTNYPAVQPKVCHLMGNVIETVRTTGSEY